MKKKEKYWRWKRASVRNNKIRWRMMIGSIISKKKFTSGDSSGTLPIQLSDKILQSHLALLFFSKCRCMVATRSASPSARGPSIYRIGIETVCRYSGLSRGRIPPRRSFREQHPRVRRTRTLLPWLDLDPVIDNRITRLTHVSAPARDQRVSRGPNPSWPTLVIPNPGR